MSTQIKDAQHLDLAQCKHIHFIGIGGIGISALAQMMQHRGVTVSGTNDSESPETLDNLRKAGAHITTNLGVELPSEADTFVYSVAWEGRAPQVLEAARATGKPLLTYFEALGQIAKEYKVIAIAGTHGKTTTTAMTAQALIAAGLNPTVVVGSLVSWPDNTRSNFYAGGHDYLVVEACEYMRHFLHFNPHILGITNIEAEHLDYYKDLVDVEDAFAQLASQSETVISEDTIRNYLLRVPELKLPGEHMRWDAALALAVADAAGADLDKAKDALANFTGTWRRFEYLGETLDGAAVYDDYAHHPSEIKATLQAAREKFGDRKLVAVFEPHTYSRTQALMSDFATAFTDANEVIIAPIYAAREEAVPGITAAALASKIREHNPNVQSTEMLAQAGELAKQLARIGDVIFFMGAGDIYTEANKAVKK